MGSISRSFLSIGQITRLISKQNVVIGECGLNRPLWALPVRLKTNLSSPQGVTGSQTEKKSSPMVNVILENGNIAPMAIGQAVRMARSKEKKLLPLGKGTDGIEAYKFATGAEYYQAEMERKRAAKEEHETKHHEKHLVINCKIASHDLEQKADHVKKWLAKECKIDVVINFAETEESKAEGLYAQMEDALKTEGRFLQKRVKQNALRFHIMPVKK